MSKRLLVPHSCCPKSRASALGLYLYLFSSRLRASTVADCLCLLTVYGLSHLVWEPLTVAYSKEQGGAAIDRNE
jgi:hypothetical protein